MYPPRIVAQVLKYSLDYLDSSAAFLVCFFCFRTLYSHFFSFYMKLVDCCSLQWMHDCLIYYCKNDCMTEKIFKNSQLLPSYDILIRFWFSSSFTGFYFKLVKHLFVCSINHLLSINFSIPPKNFAKNLKYSFAWTTFGFSHPVFLFPYLTLIKKTVVFCIKIILDIIYLMLYIEKNQL